MARSTNTLPVFFVVAFTCLSLSASQESDLFSRSELSPIDLLHAVHSGGQFQFSNHTRSPAPGISLLSDRVEEEEEKEEDDEEIHLSSGHDCRTAKNAAEASRRNNPTAKTYIPSCSSDGQYQEIQCYEDFCWCVDTVKGIPMKGSGSSRNTTMPDCSGKRAVPRVPDCNLEQKFHFLKLLTSLFRQQMMQARSSRTSTRRSRSNAKILRWKFETLDLDKNQVLDNREWKKFKLGLKGSKKRRNRQSAPFYSKSFKSVRHCFRLFFRGCDLNSDRKIIRDEWMDCTGGASYSGSDVLLSISSPEASHFRGRRQRTNLRKGPNPFATILKDD